MQLNLVSKQLGLHEGKTLSFCIKNIDLFEWIKTICDINLSSISFIFLLMPLSDATFEGLTLKEKYKNILQIIARKFFLFLFLSQ